MKKMLSLVLIFILLGSFSYSQEFNPPVKGEKAMLFGFSGLANLGVREYQGGYGYKMYLSNSMALRMALMLNYNNTKIPYPEAPNTIGEDGYDKTFGIGTEIAFEIHKGGGRIDPYFGVGGGFFMTTTELAGWVSGPTGGTLPPQQTLKNKLGGAAGMNFGTFFLLGMEYYITDNLSLAGEYHFGFDYTAALTQISDDGTTTTETTGGSSIGFGITSSGLLTLAIYR